MQDLIETFSRGKVPVNIIAKTMTQSSTWLTIIGCLVLTNLNAQNMDQHQWNNRVIIIHADDESNSQYQTQLQAFSESQEGLHDRKFVLYHVINDKFKVVHYAEKNHNSSWQDVNSTREPALKQKQAFEIILVGLDGGIKLRQTEILTEDALFRLVDSMPMRVQEMRSKDGQGY